VKGSLHEGTPLFRFFFEAAKGGKKEKEKEESKA